MRTETTAEKKYRELLERMMEYTRGDVALAFSGGVDSSLLLKTACECAEKQGTRVIAVTFQTRLHPPCDLEIASRVAQEMRAEHVILVVDELEMEEIRQNPENRCYLCKKNLFGRLKKFADERGIRCLMDGTNEDDLHVYRPGLKALEEYGVESPLARCGITKKEVKELAALCGISVASRPSVPCMATRLPYGSELSYELLERIAKGEELLRRWLGEQSNIRLRVHGEVARIETDEACMELLLKRRCEVTQELKGLGFEYITMDLEGFRSGSMDQKIRTAENEEEQESRYESNFERG